MEDPPPLRLGFGLFDLDEANARLLRDGKPVPLTPKALAVLSALARHPGRLIMKGDLLDAVWGHRHVSESVLKTVVSELRTVMGDDARLPRFIETVPRRGYRFVAALHAGVDPLNPGNFSVPAKTASTSREQPIGRRTELARALAAWAQVSNPGASGRYRAGASATTVTRRIVWISGEAGIGKTTLIDWLAAEANPARLARGHCIEQFGSSEPYLPVLEALGGLCRIDPSVQSLMRSVAPTWLLQMPWLCSETERADLQRQIAGSHPDRMLREFCELLDRYTPENPLLLVTEDLHWSDHATIRLIDYFARSRGPSRVLWLGSFRPADAIATEHPLAGVRHELRASGLCEEIGLDPFSEREVGDYLAARFSAATASKAAEPFVRSLHLTTDGLPLFVVNVVDDLMSQGLVREGPSGVFPHAVSQIPESVAGVIEMRIARLAPELQSLLGAAAVCGVEFGCSALAALVEREPEWVAECCESLVQRQYWLRAVGIERLADGSLDARYRFRHALYRQVFYRRLGAHAVAGLHVRLARSLEQRRRAGADVPAAEIALHFEQGHDPLQAVRHYASAVDNALERFAAVEAQELLERAISLLPRCPAGDERLGLEFIVAGRRDAICGLLEGFSSPATRALLERARSLSDVLPQTPERAWIALGIGWGFFQRGDLASAHALGKRVQAVASNHDDLALLTSAYALTGSTSTLQGELSESVHTIEQGLTLYERVSTAIPKGHRYVLDPSVVMHASMPTLLCQRGQFEQAHRHVERALATAEALRAPLSRMVAYRAAAALEVWSAGRERVLGWATAMGELAREHGMSGAEGPSLWFQGWARAMSGELEAGLALMEAGLASREKLGRLAGITHPTVLAAEAQLLAGHWEDVQPLVDRGLAWADRLGERVHVPELLLLQGEAARGLGQIQRARETWLESLRLARIQGAMWLEFLALTALGKLEGDCTTRTVELQAARGRLQKAGATLPVAGVSHLLFEDGTGPGRFAGEGPRAA